LVEVWLKMPADGRELGIVVRHVSTDNCAVLTIDTLAMALATDKFSNFALVCPVAN